MGGLLERSRKLVGAGLVRLGLAVLGYKDAAVDDPSRDGDDDADDGLPPNVAPAILSDVARSMIADGNPGWVAPKNESAPPLAGSLADRQRTARREMGR